MSLLSDFEGFAKVILVTSPGRIHASEAQATLKKQLGNLPIALHAKCKILWMFTAEATTASFAPFEISGRAVLPIPLFSKYEASGNFRWVQDPFYIANDSLGRYILMPSNAAPETKMLCLELAIYLQCRVKRTKLLFEGGNMLRIGNTMLVGKDTAFINKVEQQGAFLNPRQKTWLALENEVKMAFSTSHIIWIGLQRKISHGFEGPAFAPATSWQPFFHLDLFLLPAANDPNGNPRMLVGKIENLNDEKLSINQRSQIAQIEQQLNEVIALITYEMPQIKIARLPIITKVEGNRMAVQSLCNGWVESWGTQTKAFLPDFRNHLSSNQDAKQTERFQLEAEATLKAWNIHCRWIDMGFRELSREGGALHCSVKILDIEK